MNDKYLRVNLNIYDITGVYLCESLLKKACKDLKSIYSEKEEDIFIIQQIVAEKLY
jgi:hypothetical protein